MTGDNEFRLALHARLVSTADLLLAQFNPCRIQDKKCLAGEYCCVRTRFKRRNREDRRCYFLDPDGCTFTNIWCKTWFCHAVRALQDEPTVTCLTAMDALHQVAKLYGLTYERTE